MNWHFNVIDGTVHLNARLEDDDDRIGDAHSEIARGEEFYGVPYAAMMETGSGIVEVDENGVGRLVPPDESEQ